ncbi:GbsR/MarR family transcriptional regulator [Noviherbaspirillum autotrophicum]|uniref:HTH-type transcriptional regulator n=1 Tax=Noviherbaspirillum autotrophicum TaxID=709839 RepID=A0A0C2BRE5_9BURK|nr:MarR family transcriptional regulator [Noviherbaspirillum autotrophicum]KIF80651.1 MarR family transcriptional regulator [Noviherbaspirillum autotrophicum]
MELKPVAQKFILHWGEMGTRWGVNRTVSQIHALLYIAGRPMHAEEIAETLGVARSNVSTSLKELQGWKLVKIAHLMGERRDHFETSLDVWELFRTVVRERKEREFDPTITTLRECLASPDLSQEEQAAQERIAQTLALMEILTTWADEMLRLEPATLMKLLKMGASVQKFVRGDGKASSTQPDGGDDEQPLLPLL